MTRCTDATFSSVPDKLLRTVTALLYIQHDRQMRSTEVNDNVNKSQRNSKPDQHKVTSSNAGWYEKSPIPDAEMCNRGKRQDLVSVIHDRDGILWTE